MSDVIIYDRMQERRGTAANLASVNEVLREGEPCYETDTTWPGGGRKFKIGDGTTAWNSLAYAVPDVGGGGGGKLLNYASTSSSTAASTTSSIPIDNTIPQNTEGAAYASLDTTITPTDSSSLLEVTVFIPAANIAVSGWNMMLALFRDSTANAIAVNITTAPGASTIFGTTLQAIVSAGSTSATTFKLRWGVQGSTGYLLRTAGTAALFGGALQATMTVREIG